MLDPVLGAPAPGAPGSIRQVRRALTAALLAAVALAALPAPATAAPPAAERFLSVRPAARRADIDMSHVWQSLNNCGPASVTMLLSSLGVRASQEDARIALRGTNVLRGMGTANVDPWVSAEFGLHAFSRNNGTSALLKTLITNGFAPMVTQWLDDRSRTAHWRAVRGYDDDQGVFYASDPMRGAAVPLSYDWFADNWMPFQYRYLVIYRPEDEELLRAIVGEVWFDVPSRFAYLARAKSEAESLDTYEAWLSYGEAAYQAGHFEESVGAFETGIAKGSANGIFNVRTSYPAALRLLGREQEARAVAGRLASTPSSPLATSAPDDIRQIQALVGDRPVTLSRNELDLAAAYLASRTQAQPLEAR